MNIPTSSASPLKAPSIIAVTTVMILGVGCDLAPDDRNVWLVDTTPFVVEATSLEDRAVDVPLNQPITLWFTHYLDPTSFEYYNALVVESGGIRAGGFSRYRMWERSLTFFPTRTMRPDLTYTISVNPDTVRSIGGYELSVDFELIFQTASEGTVEQDRRIPARSFAAEIAPIFDARCSCHDGFDDLTSLEYDQLVDTPSRASPQRLLVRPTFPEDSYLLHKILPDYPDRRWTVMPPEWADEEALDTGDVQLIEEWIATGALP